jgi:hypothetical protein
LPLIFFKFPVSKKTVGVEPLPNIGDKPHHDHHEEKIDETQFNAKEREQRIESAKRIQGIARTRNARKETEKRRELKRKRSEMPAQDAHGHANPSTIKIFNSFPLIHIHHHGEK